jgi:hypothetical protein
MAEKLEYRTPHVRSPARRSLESLQKAGGYVVLGKGPGGDVDWCRIDVCGGGYWYWRRVTPGGGKDAVFELEARRDAPP